MQKIDMAKKTSYIWQHYKIIDHHNARCNVCNKRLSYKTSISNLKKHMNLKHPSVGVEDNSNYTMYPSTPTQDDEEDNDNNFGDDAEDVKTLLGLTGAQVDKNIEIIEEVNNGNHLVYHNDDSNERIVKTKAKPALKKCLKAIERKIKKEPSLSADDTTPTKNRDDTIDVLTQNIGNKLRKMTDRQQMIAEYKIHEILFLGLSSQLKCPVDYGMNSQLMNQNQTMNQHYSLTGMNTGESELTTH